MKSESVQPSLFSAEDAGDGLTAADRDCIERIAPEMRREAAALLSWYRSHAGTVAAFAEAARELMRERVPAGGFAPLHVAAALRHPLRAGERRAAEIGNGEAVFCARVVRLLCPDLARAFAVSAAPVADAIFAAGWKPE